MKKIIACSGILLANSFTAQTANPASTSVSSPMDNIKQLFPAAPTSNNLMKFEEVPVSNYTGIPDIEIPISAIPTNEAKISVNVSLKYHPLNAKPDDKSGEEGLGWSLFAGGSITRTIRGSADDLVYEGTDKKVGILYDEYNYAAGETNYTRKYLDESATGAVYHTSQYKKLLYETLFLNRYDTEYDLYQYNFMGYTGRFIIKKSSGNDLYVEKLDKNNLKVSIGPVDPNKPLQVISFVVTDEYGNNFIFDVTERSQRSIISNKTGHYGAYNTSLKDLGESNTAFHLSRITNASNTELVKLDYYPPLQVQYTDTSNISRNKITSENGNSLWTAQHFDNVIPAASENNITTSNTWVRSLKEIEVTGKGKISFTYLQGREDTNYVAPQQLQKLNKVSITDPSGKVLDTYELSYGYFNYNLAGEDLPHKQLSLSKITKFDSALNKAFDYVFDYTGNVQNRTLGRDSWGWFNCPRPNTNFLLAKYVSPDCTTINILKSIKLPSGGIRAFDFGANTYSSDHTGSAITDFDDNTENWTYSTTTPVTLQSTLFNDAVYSLGKTFQDKILVIENGQILNNENNTGFLFLEKLNLNQQLVQSYGINVTDTEINLEGGFFYRFKFTWTNANDQGTANINYSYKTRNPVQKQWLYGGGIRINNIRYYDNPGDALAKKAVSFSYSRFSDPAKSSGALVFPKPLLNYEYDYSNAFVASCGGGSNTYCSYPYQNGFRIYSSGNFLPVQKTQGSDIGYQNITVFETGKGKTEYSYTSPIDNPNPDPVYISFGLPPFLPVDNYDYKRGLLKRDEKKDHMNVNLYQKNNDYTTYDSKILTGLNINYINSPYSEYVYGGHFNSYETYEAGCIKNQSMNLFCADRTNVSSMMRILPVREIIGKANPTHSETTAYLNGKMLKTYEDTTFNTRDYPTKQVTRSQNSGITEISYQYAHEKNNQKLISANIIAIPLETTVVKKQNIDDMGKIKMKTEIRYDNLGNKHPSSFLSLDLSNNTLATELTYDKYDEKGNLQQYTKENGSSATIIWGYSKTQPIAMVEGAKLSDISQSLIDSIVNASATDYASATGNDESAFLAALDAFRKDASLAGYQITTYTYDPLIGLRSVTAPTGLREVYIYDTANRLKEIRENNENGKILQEFTYNYKN
ncbi:hypothetical protein FY557_08840 [Chryseobacterium sp. SN22]|uniref:hypothetical protein n=1 Tax=Chryseobacterium sp. SN22 TaxID=2606431 RepID=UPI0011F09A8E|nr:hypothetical protein [Chryseobacterium sp. SN22]KAA0128367.1 hypothetical protein FY557_08840 [Chryseobacterium sp. SN22]